MVPKHISEHQGLMRRQAALWSSCIKTVHRNLAERTLIYG